jgi:hypothetical protein
MHNGYDTCKLDAVRIGNRFYSAFRYGRKTGPPKATAHELDQQRRTDDNGYIRSSIGDRRLALCSGAAFLERNWIDLIGQNITFSYQTNVVCCGYRGKVENTNETGQPAFADHPALGHPPGESEQLTAK